MFLFVVFFFHHERMKKRAVVLGGCAGAQTSSDVDLAVLPSASPLKALDSSQSETVATYQGLSNEPCRSNFFHFPFLSKAPACDG